MSTLGELIARVEGATRKDLRLADDILFATGHTFSLAFLSDTGWKFRGVSLAAREVDVTASLDAALALCERVLPGWLPSVEKRRGLSPPTPTGASPVDISGHPGWEVWTARALLTAGDHHTANAPTPALALILAMLRALASTPEGEPS